MTRALLLVLTCTVFYGIAGFPGLQGLQSRDEAPLRHRDGEYEVKVQLAGVPTWCVLDTGASRTALQSSLLHSLPPGSYNLTGISVITLADGSDGVLPVVTLRQVRVGHRQLNDIEVLVLPAGRPLIGQNVLDQLGPWMIDRQSGIILFDMDLTSEN
ncbi:MAG: aspartyl protease family protein [Sulfobacillus sp.]